MLSTKVSDVLANQHRELDALLRLQLETIIALDFTTAVRLFGLYAERLELHLAAESRWIFPLHEKVKTQAWPTEMYRAEHRKLMGLLASQAARLAAAAKDVPSSASARRRLALSLLDAVHPLRSLLEHHEEREEKGLLQELPHDAHAAKCCARAMARLLRKQGDAMRALYGRRAAARV